MKYKIQITEGCTAFDTTINGKSEINLLPEEREEFMNYLMEQLKAGIKDGTVSLNSVIQNFQYSDFGSKDGSCGQCGDSVSWTVWEI